MAKQYFEGNHRGVPYRGAFQRGKADYEDGYEVSIEYFPRWFRELGGAVKNSDRWFHEERHKAGIIVRHENGKHWSFCLPDRDSAVELWRDFGYHYMGEQRFPTEGKYTKREYAAKACCEAYIEEYGLRRRRTVKLLAERWRIKDLMERKEHHCLKITSREQYSGPGYYNLDAYFKKREGVLYHSDTIAIGEKKALTALARELGIELRQEKEKTSEE